MTVWWERGRAAAQRSLIKGGQPQLVPGGRDALIDALQARIVGFTPDWQPGSDGDPGDALIKLFGTQLDPVIKRIEQLDDNAIVQFLSTAGLGLGTARPARALVTFEVSPTAHAPVIVPQGFQLSSATADGSPGEVVWETEDTLAAVPGKVAELFVFDGEVTRSVKPGEAFQPFGAEQRAGSYLLIGLDTPLEPTPTLSLGVQVPEPGEGPAPLAEGGEPRPTSPAPLLRWEALAQGRFQPVEIITDGSAGTSRTGVVELRAPREFAPDRPSAAGKGQPRRWLRLRLIQGQRQTGSAIASLYLNMVAATAARTIRDEWPTPVGASAPHEWRLSQTPIVQTSIILEVDEGVEALVDEDVGESEPGFRRWLPVETLAGQPADARVFVLDAATGIIRFGDNIMGRSPPPGVRNIVARSYQVATGRAGAVEIGSITRMLRSIPDLKSVTNPLPASGGSDAETLAQIMPTGPSIARARGRGVSPGDMALVVERAADADVARAFALRGVDPTYPGARVPGTVGLFVVPRRRPGDARAGPPLADQSTLDGAARSLATLMGPIGARIVAANPRYHDVRIESSVEIDPAADAGATVRKLLDVLDAYLDPYIGGEAGEGWALGSPLRHSRLVRRLLEGDPAVRSVPYLSITVDGQANEPCNDAPLSAFGLPWSNGHEVVPQVAAATP